MLYTQDYVPFYGFPRFLSSGFVAFTEQRRKNNEILKHIDMVGNDLAFGQGNCGSASGSVPVNVGQPTIRVDEIVVGGRGGSINEF